MGKLIKSLDNNNNSQRKICNEYKRVYGLKRQNIVLSNGMFGKLVGLYKVRRHDSFMFAESSLLQQFEQRAWF